MRSVGLSRHCAVLLLVGALFHVGLADASRGSLSKNHDDYDVMALPQGVKLVSGEPVLTHIEWRYDVGAPTSANNDPSTAEPSSESLPVLTDEGKVEEKWSKEWVQEHLAESPAIPHNETWSTFYLRLKPTSEVLSLPYRMEASVRYDKDNVGYVQPVINPFGTITRNWTRVSLLYATRGPAEAGPPFSNITDIQLKVGDDSSPSSLSATVDVAQAKEFGMKNIYEGISISSPTGGDVATKGFVSVLYEPRRGNVTDMLLELSPNEADRFVYYLATPDSGRRLNDKVTVHIERLVTDVALKDVSVQPIKSSELTWGQRERVYVDLDLCKQAPNDREVLTVVSVTSRLIITGESESQTFDPLTFSYLKRCTPYRPELSSSTSSRATSTRDWCGSRCPSWCLCCVRLIRGRSSESLTRFGYSSANDSSAGPSIETYRDEEGNVVPIADDPASGFKPMQVQRKGRQPTASGKPGRAMKQPVEGEAKSEAERQAMHQRAVDAVMGGPRGIAQAASYGIVADSYLPRGGSAKEKRMGPQNEEDHKEETQLGDDAL